MAERFYVSSPLGTGDVVLDGPEAHHLATVCRLRPDDAVCLFNGDGAEYQAVIRTVARRQVILEVTAVSRPVRERAAPVVVGAPLPKGDRAHLLIEKLTELGVARFVPLRTRRSVVHPHDGKLDRLQRAVVEASKQCGRNVLMEIEPVCDWDAWVCRADLPPARWIAHPAAGTDRACAAPATDGCVGCVGPEGGFTDEEVSHALAAGWRPLDFGPRVLRIETAAVLFAGWAVIEPRTSHAPSAAAHL